MAGKGRNLAYGRGALPLRKPPSLSSTVFLYGLLLFSLLIAAFILLGIFSISTSSKNSLKNSPDEALDIASIAHNSVLLDDGDVESMDQWVEVISWEPRASVFHNFLSREECEYLISIAEPHMEKSTVVDGATGKSVDSRVRTSSGTFLVRGRDKIVQKIEKRIADVTFIPVENGEGLQVLHYEAGQRYEPHYDYFGDEFNTQNGGQRIATVLMYLLCANCQQIRMVRPFFLHHINKDGSDVEEGGETVFPVARGNFSSLPWWKIRSDSDCGKTGLSVTPKRGDALLFWSLKPDATEDPTSLHGGCPVIKGNKWSSTKWLRLNEFKI